jgi:CheY-like chemotaxis protein
MFFRRKKVVEVAPVPGSAADTKTASQNTGAPRKKILVVDDDPIMVKTLSLTLNARGYNVLSAADGSEAISVVRREKPDMLLVDVCLPPDVASGGVMPWNGFQITRWLQRMNNGKIPALIISGADKPEYKLQAVAAGADGFMAKPINSTQLLSSVASALADRQSATADFVALKMAN